jgi:hypothetical protein
MSNEKFDPVQEINKEKKIENFFQQKYTILSSYLNEGVDDEEIKVMPRRKKPKSS